MKAIVVAAKLAMSVIFSFLSVLYKKTQLFSL